MALIVQVEIIRRTEKKTTHLGVGRKVDTKLQNQQNQNKTMQMKMKIIIDTHYNFSQFV